MPQLDPSSFLSQLFWLAISFSLLYVVLVFVLLPRIRSILEHRQFTIEKGLAEARQFRDKAQSAMADYQSALAHARTESAKIMQHATLAYQQKSSKALADVDKEIEAALTKADAALVESKKRAMTEGKEVSLVIAQDVVKAIAGFDANPTLLRNLLQEAY